MADYYSEGGDSPETPMPEGGEAGEGMEKQPEEQGEESVAESALLPKSILAGKTFNVGDEVVLKIKAMHDDEIEVEYATEKGGDKGEPEMRSTGDSMNRMAKYADKP